MVISFYGDGCFRLQNGETSILTNPLNNRLKADIVLKTATEAKKENEPVENPSGEFFFPGEYETKGIYLRGFGERSEQVRTFFLIKWEDFGLAFLDKVSKMPVAEALEEIGDADILILSVNEKYLSLDETIKLIKQIEPKILIPHFPDSKTEKSFLKLIDKKAEYSEKLVVKKKDVENFKTKIFILSPTK